MNDENQNPNPSPIPETELEPGFEPKYFSYQGASTTIHGYRVKARFGGGRGRLTFKSFYISPIRDKAATYQAAKEWALNPNRKASTRPGAPQLPPEPRPRAQSHVQAETETKPPPVHAQAHKAEPYGDPVWRTWTAGKNNVRYVGWIAKRTIEGNIETQRYPVSDQNKRHIDLEMAIKWQNQTYYW